MRLFFPFLAFAAFVAAQSSGNNVINNPPEGIQASAGEPLTITWANPTSGTITIKLQTSGDVEASDGIVVAENIPNTGSATFEVPADVPSGEIFVEIIDDADPSDFNFSNGFQVQGATGSRASASASANASESSSSPSSGAASSSASESSTRSAYSTYSKSSSSMSSGSTPSASAGASSTSAPTGAAVPLKLQAGSGLMAAILAAAGVFL